MYDEVAQFRFVQNPLNRCETYNQRRMKILNLRDEHRTTRLTGQFEIILRLPLPCQRALRLDGVNSGNILVGE